MGQLCTNVLTRNPTADFYRDSKNLLKIFFFVSKHVCINFTFAAWAGSHDDGQIFNEYCKSFMGQLCTNVLTRNPWKLNRLRVLVHGFKAEDEFAFSELCCQNWGRWVDRTVSLTRKKKQLFESRSNGLLSRVILRISVNPFTPKISAVILLTVCHTIFMMFDRRIWYWINQ